jgi:hypothetical protein
VYPRSYLPTQSLHQPCALIGPSTSWQEDGGINTLQFSHLWLSVICPAADQPGCPQSPTPPAHGERTAERISLTRALKRWRSPTKTDVQTTVVTRSQSRPMNPIFAVPAVASHPPASACSPPEVRASHSVAAARIVSGSSHRRGASLHVRRGRARPRLRRIPRQGSGRRKFHAVVGF